MIIRGFTFFIRIKIIEREFIKLGWEKKSIINITLNKIIKKCLHLFASRY